MNHDVSVLVQMFIAHNMCGPFPQDCSKTRIFIISDVTMLKMYIVPPSKGLRIKSLLSIQHIWNYKCLEGENG